jgi:hypothetical protein
VIRTERFPLPHGRALGGDHVEDDPVFIEVGDDGVQSGRHPCAENDVKSRTDLANSTLNPR